MRDTLGRRLDDVAMAAVDDPHKREPHGIEAERHLLPRPRSSRNIAAERQRDPGHHGDRDRMSPDASTKDLDISRPPRPSDVDHQTGGFHGYDERMYRYQESRPSILDSPPTECHPNRLMQGNGGDLGPPRGFDKTDKRHGVRKGVPRVAPVGDAPSNVVGRSSELPTKHHLDPSSAALYGPRSRQKLDSSLRNDSLSSDPSDCAQPSKPHRHRNGRKRQSSMSSSDDGIQTTPEGTSAEEQELESESISEKGALESAIRSCSSSPVYFV